MISIQKRIGRPDLTRTIVTRTLDALRARKSSRVIFGIITFEDGEDGARTTVFFTSHSALQRERRILLHDRIVVRVSFGLR